MAGIDASRVPLVTVSWMEEQCGCPLSEVEIKWSALIDRDRKGRLIGEVVAIEVGSERWRWNKRMSPEIVETGLKMRLLRGLSNICRSGVLDAGCGCWRAAEVDFWW